MPRPRVPPSQRRRAAEACSFCREAKKRCSGTAPCTHCLRRGIGAQCSISSGHRRPWRGGLTPGGAPAASSASLSVPAGSPGGPMASFGRRRGRSSAVATPRQDTQTLPEVGPQDFTPSDRFGGNLMAEPGQDGAAAGNSSRSRHRPSDATSISPNPHSRMLLNLRGERVYIGGAASLSFLQLIRGIVAEQIGPSQFSHNEKSDTMLEKESPSSSRNAATVGVVELDADTKLEFSRVYHAVTEGFLDVFAPAEIEKLLLNTNTTNSFNTNGRKGGAVDLVIAIGAQAKSADTARDVGQSYFRQAQGHAFSGMLEDPDIDMVRYFLLMAFYLLGECRRNSAFMYLGIATRAAVALGLHSRESYTDMTNPNERLRLRVWVSLRIVDMLANSILGRPAATAGLHSDIDGLLDDLSDSGKDEDMVRLIASHQIVCIINGIVDMFYERKGISIAGVEQLLKEIESWSKALPESLRTTSHDAERRELQEHNGVIGSIHVSCLYYFAVTLVSRPILISALTAQSVSGGLAQSQVASACLDAAVYLVQTCVDARKANLLYGNMCIMKALVFAAGLVLGFEIFAKSSIDFDIESAFHGAKDILYFFSNQSPQAAHYFEILTLLSTAIVEQREKIASRGRSRYVSRLFTLGQQNGTPRDGNESSCVPAPTQLSDASLNVADASWFNGGQTALGPDQEVFLGWDSLDISQWDSFPYVQ